MEWDSWKHCKNFASKQKINILGHVCMSFIIHGKQPDKEYEIKGSEKVEKSNIIYNM